MVNYKYGDLFKKDTVDKQLSIVSDDGKINITNTELHQEKFELTESLCSEQELTFGSCEAAMIKFTVSNTFLPMKGRWMTVKMSLGGHTDVPFQFGRYKVDSDTPSADRTCRDVVAYDALYDILNADVAAWYNTVFPSHKEQQKDKDGKTTTVTVYDPVTMKQFRDSFFKHFRIEQADIILVNDGMSIEKTVAVTASNETSSDTEESSTIGESMSGKEVLSCICEINGCMGHMGRDGKFHYIYLEQEIQGLYPRNDLYPADNLYPRDPKSTQIGKGFYVSAKYEDYLVRTINKLQIREQKNDIGVIVGTGDNAYVIEDNFLVYGKGTKELKGIANNVLSKIRGIVYRPFTADCKGNPCLEVGDAVRIPTKYELIESYIFKRTLKGIQALRDDLEADGEEYRTNGANGIQKSILKLKGKSNVLERTIEKTQSTITDVEKELQSQITQTASEIRTEVKNTTDGLSSRIIQNADNITAEVTRAQGQEVVLAAAIKINEDKITAEVSRASETEGKLSSKIEITATQIRSEVSSSLNTWDWDESKFDIIYFGHGDQGKGYEPSSYIENKCYLNLDNGTIWRCEKTSSSSSTYMWKYHANAKLIANNITSAFKQTSKEISTKVQKDNVISSINQTAESIKISAKKLNLDGNTKITGGTIHIETTESVDNIIQLKRPGTLVKMGNDGMSAAADTRLATFQYSNITVQDSAGAKDKDGNNITTVAQLLSSGKGISSYGWESYSDRRLKHGIKALDKKKSAKVISRLVPCEFVYNYDKNETVRHGFIAQNAIEAVNNEWEVCGKNNVDGTEYYTLDKANLIADLVATVQLQHDEIEQLKEKVENL
nr:MAG TPA: endosialidase chaperone [Caudoviricetes sp.]